MSRRLLRSETSASSVSRRGFLKGIAAATIAGTGPGLTRRANGEASEYPPATAVTQGPKCHFFGYYDKCPWDATGRYLLGMEIDYCDRNPKPGEPLTVGMVDLKDNNRYIPLDETAAWSWQQGTMLQWLGSAPDREVIYNSVEGDRYIAVVRDVRSGKTRRLPRPIYAVDRAGRQAVTLDFDRLNRLRPGYGYMALPEQRKDVAAPNDAGLYWMNLKTGDNRLIIPIEWASRNKPDDRFGDNHHWFNHLQFNPSGTRFIFLHRWRKGGSWYTRLYTAKPDGTDIRLHSDTGMVSHFDWRDDTTILAWSRTKGKGNRFYLFDVDTNATTVVGEGILTRDGHCNYSPDRKWILNDTYPDRERKQTLMIVRAADTKRIDIGKFFLPPELKGPFRCDLHPRWNRDGTAVCIDSAHTGKRQLYVIDVGHITKA